MDSAERRGENEALFREINEQIEQLAEEWDHPEERAWEFVCECERTDCVVPLDMTVGEYESVREQPERFLVAPGHSDPATEDVIVRTANYWLVEKRGEAAEVAEETDPRG